MIQKKSFLMALKRAFQTGTFNYVGQEAKQFPNDLCHIEDLKIDDQNWWQCNPISKIDLSNNQIPQIPQEISVLSDLQLIRMKNNLVTNFPKSLISLQNLKSVDLSRNKLKFLPQEISFGISLVQLNFSQNMLQTIPNLQKLRNLQFIFIDRNKLKELPNLGSAIKKVEAFQNQISVIRKSTFQLCQLLQHLNLNKNQIQHIQINSFNGLNNLVTLQMKQNKMLQFKQVPNSLKLDTITLSFNRLTTYDQFQKSPNLTVLVLNDNKIKTLSKNIFILKKLKTLDVSNNDLSDLPCQLGFINSLVRLQLEGNPLKSIRQTIKTGGTNLIKKYLQEKMDPNQKANVQNKVATSFQKVSQADYWKKLLQQFNQSGQLVLRKMNLKQIDQYIFRQGQQLNLKVINFSQNNIRSLSEQIARLQNLKQIILNNNQLEQLPAGIVKIQRLEQLQVKHNKLSSFGDNMTKLVQHPFPFLHFLDLSANKIKNVPKIILQLRKLRTLHLSYNQISDVQSLWNPNCLPKLQILDISSNQIQQISDNIFKKASVINYLNIQNNSLTKLPTVIGFMKLSGFKIDGNPIKLIKRAVIDKGTVAILQYLRTKHVGPIPQIEVQKIQQQDYYHQEKMDIESKYQSNQRGYGKMRQPQHQEKTNFNPQIQIQNQNQFSQQNYQYFQEPKKPKLDFITIQNQVKCMESEISFIQRQIDVNMSMNNIQKNQRKKKITALMIEKNKLLKMLQ